MRILLHIILLLAVSNSARASGMADGKDSTRHKLLFGFGLSKKHYQYRMYNLQSLTDTNILIDEYSSGRYAVFRDSLIPAKYAPGFLPTEISAMISYRGIETRLTYVDNSLSQSLYFELGYAYTFKFGLMLGAVASLGNTSSSNQVERWVYDRGDMNVGNEYYSYYYPFNPYRPNVYSTEKVTTTSRSRDFELFAGWKLNNHFDLLFSYRHNRRKQVTSMLSADFITHGYGLSLRYHFWIPKHTSPERAKRKRERREREKLLRLNVGGGLQFSLANKIYTYNTYTTPPSFYRYPQNSFAMGGGVSFCLNPGILLRGGWLLSAHYVFGKATGTMRIDGANTHTGPDVTTTRNNFGGGLEKIFTFKNKKLQYLIGAAYQWGNPRITTYFPSTHPPSKNDHLINYKGKTQSLLVSTGFRINFNKAWLYMGMEATPMSQVKGSYTHVHSRWSDLQPSIPVTYYTYKGEVSDNLSSSEMKEMGYLLALSVKFGYTLGSR